MSPKPCRHLYHRNEIKNLFESKAKTIKPLNLRIQKILNEMKISPKIMHNTILPKTAQWIINQPKVKLELSYLRLKHTPSLSKRNSSTSKIKITTSIQMGFNKE